MTYAFIIVEFDDAVHYVETHRNMKPRIYNRKRQFERPLPNLEFENDNYRHLNMDIEPELSSHQVHNSLNEVEIELGDRVGANGTENAVTSEMDPLSIDDTEIDIKPDPLILFEANRDQIENLLSGATELDESSSTEEIVFLIDGTDFPMPMQCDSHDLVKRENDEMSGNISYNDKVFIWVKRIYL